MEQNTFIIVVGLSLVVFLLALRSIRVVPEYVRLVILALGRYAGTRGLEFRVCPGSGFRWTCASAFWRSTTKTSITKDNAPIVHRLSVYYRVIEPNCRF
jgi:regulator of protease activity HflC (stomatin/prohibitin superfamily)